ncbi:hypothetical protein [Mangrovibacterium marinum]|uniref:hypothetical protein n=1 Tax=Mangrovibacterium marinum TaxID=1639118 RepID=UPI002A18DC39|nr:hypothetical protein [Mangrovibacterium marinum]
MSNTKGFEVKFRGHEVQLSECQMDVMDVKIQKQNDLFSVCVGGIIDDKICTLFYEYDLCEGDEITIERKHLIHSSDSGKMSDFYEEGKEPSEMAHNQHRLTLFYELESYLTEKGLIE